MNPAESDQSPGLARRALAALFAVTGTIDDAKAKVMGLPAKATEATAKLTAAFAT